MNHPSHVYAGPVHKPSSSGRKRAIVCHEALTNGYARALVLAHVATDGNAERTQQLSLSVRKSLDLERARGDLNPRWRRAPESRHDTT